jgi:hypothetical protein
MLLRFYVEDARCDAHFERLSQTWRPVYALLVTGEPEDAESSDANVAYQHALNSVVGDKFGLADKNGDTLQWAGQWVHRHVVLEAERSTTEKARALGKFSPWRWVSTFDPDAELFGMPGLVIYAGADFARCYIPGWDTWEHDDVLESFIGCGFGPGELPKFKKRMRVAVKDAVAYAERRFDEATPKRGRTTKPTTIKLEREALKLLSDHLITAAKIIEKRSKKQRAYEMAAALGIQCPRRPLRG